MKRIIFLLLFFLLSYSVLGIGLSSQPLKEIVFEPGKVITNTYTVTGTDRPFEVEVSGPYEEYFVLEKQGTNTFFLTVTLPQSQLPSGIYPHQIVAKEIPSGEAQGGANSLTTISKKIPLKVFAYGKDLESFLSIPNVNEGEKTSLTLTLASRGYEDIQAASAVILISGDGFSKNLVVGPKPLPALESISFEEELSLPAGLYTATATVQFDGAQQIINRSFAVGSMDVALQSYQNYLFKGFSEFNATLENLWGKRLDNVYLSLKLSGQQLLQTPSISLDPWSAGIVKGITSIELPEGEYQGTAVIHFEGQTKEVPLTITIGVPPQEKSLFGPILIALIVIALIVGVYIVWRKNQEYE